MIIRPLVKSDTDSLLKARELGFTDGFNESMIASGFNSGNFYGFIAEDDGVTGFITYTLTQDFAEIADLFVFPKFRKKGVGTALVFELIKTVKNSGRGKIFLEVRKGNFAAKNLYKKIGFTDLYERKKYYGDEDAEVMVKEFAENRNDRL